MKTQANLTLIPGTAEYFEARRVAFALIREVEAAKRVTDKAPMYVRGGWDEGYGDYEPIENTGPFEHLGEIQTKAKADRFVVETLKAQNRLDVLGISRWEAEAIIHGASAEILMEERVLVHWQGLTYSDPCAYANRIDLELVRPPRSDCFLLTKTTYYWGFRPGLPGVWKETVSVVLTDRNEAVSRCCHSLSEARDFAEQVRRRYERAA